MGESIPKTDVQPEQPVKKFTLEERAEKLGKTEVLEALKEQARGIEEMLYGAYKIVDDRVVRSIRDEDRILIKGVVETEEGKLLTAEQPHKIRDLLVKLAHDVRQLSDQYRDFEVGGALLAVRKPTESNPNPWTVLFNANTKPSAHEKKWCAELYLLDGIERRDDIEKIVTMATVGQAQPDDDSRRDQVTLSPCILCRNRLHELAEDEEVPWIDLYTEIYTVRAEKKGWDEKEKLLHPKLFQVKDLHKFHGENNGDM
jgi:cytidine deaminase